MSRDRTLDHTKNFSFTYTEDNGWRLSPAYDLTYSDTYWGEQTTSVGGKGKDISDKDPYPAEPPNAYLCQNYSITLDQNQVHPISGHMTLWYPHNM